MNIPVFQIDAFTNQLFGGNSAAVCPLKEWMPDEILKNIAKENNLAETAFFIPLENNRFHLRWFTPEIEMDLCGHATLASAFVLFHEIKIPANTIYFETASGELIVTKQGDFIEMNFPSRPPTLSTLPTIIRDGINIQPQEVWKSRDYVLVYQNEEEIKKIIPDIAILNQINIDPGGIIVTAKGKEVDFVSRFFTPQASIFEDPVTGSAHCTLVPFWANRLQKNKLHALQISDRKGELFCELKEGRVFMKGHAVKFMEGKLKNIDY